MDKYTKFKCLLEYFVAHLQYIQSSTTKTIGYKKYIAPLIKKNTFKQTGQGYNGGSIQNQISDWEMYENGRICINVQSNFGDYSSKKSYLNWEGTGLNVYAKWNSTKDEIDALGLTEYRYWLDNPDYINSTIFPLSDIGLYDGKSPNSKLQEMFDTYEKSQINNRTYDMAKNYIENLETNKNIVLHGAPGTGKTFVARQIAAQMMFNKAYENLSDDEKNEIGFVQFHPSYDYTDFVEGLRPVKQSQIEIGFTRKNGIFKNFCEKAINEKNKKFVFIIDEINRGDISKIFGELFFSIDPAYRGINGKVNTQYQNLIEEKDTFYKGFYIPDNVYIIGTMNDIDRSVECMDFAMRRRFVFFEITAKDSAEAMGIDYSEDSPMKKLNDAIEEKLGCDYQIGGAYFKNYKDSLNDSNKLKELWDKNLKGLLQEYLRGQREAKIILSDFESVFYGNNKTN